MKLSSNFSTAGGVSFHLQASPSWVVRVNGEEITNPVTKAAYTALSAGIGIAILSTAAVVTAGAGIITLGALAIVTSPVTVPTYLIIRCIVRKG
jgi:hypothetical protein